MFQEIVEVGCAEWRVATCFQRMLKEIVKLGYAKARLAFLLCTKVFGSWLGSLGGLPSILVPRGANEAEKAPGLGLGLALRVRV